MLRGLTLAAIAMGLALVGASLLRTERRAGAGAVADKGPAAPRGCIVRTRSGAPCSRAAEPGSDRCWQHR